MIDGDDIGEDKRGCWWGGIDIGGGIGGADTGGGGGGGGFGGAVKFNAVFEWQLDIMELLKSVWDNILFSLSAMFSLFIFLLFEGFK